MTFKRALVLFMLTVLAAPAFAQQRGDAQAPRAAAPAAAAPAGPMTPLKVQVVISRYQGQKQLARVPFTMAVNTNDRKNAEVVSATQVLIQGATVGDRYVGPVFKDVGIKIACRASSAEGGRFALDLEVESASIDDDQPKKDPPYRIRAFRSSQQVLLRDGQTTEYTTATDPTNGEEVKVAVTLTVVK